MDKLPPNGSASNPAPKPAQEKKRVEKVVTGEVITRKKSFGKRLRESFFPGHAETVGEYVVWDVLIPSAKDVLADMASSFMERMLFGESRPASRRPSQRGGQTSYVSYNRMNSTPPRSPYRQDPRVPTSAPGPSAAMQSFDDIVLPTRLEAEAVLTAMQTCINEYQAVTVADLYETVGLTGDYTASDWGWTDLSNVGISRVRNGYVLNLPREEKMN